MRFLFYFLSFRRNLSRQIGYDLRSIIHDVKSVDRKDVRSIAQQIHIAIEHDTSNKHKHHNCIWNICSCFVSHRKISEYFFF